MKNTLILALLLLTLGAAAQTPARNGSQTADPAGTPDAVGYCVTAEPDAARDFSAADDNLRKPRKPRHADELQAGAAIDGKPADSPTAAKPKRDYKIMLFKRPEGKEQTKRVLWRDGRWAGIGIHYSGLVTNLGNFSLPAEASYMTQSAKSIGVTINPIDFILVGSRKVHLMTGLGFELNNFRFDQNIALKYENGVLQPDYQYEEHGTQLSKSKLFTAYVNIPLLVEFQAKNFFVSAGMIGGLCIGAHTKIQADGPLVGGTAKRHGGLGMRNFHYGYALNFGYSNIGFNVTYYHSPLWREGAGPQVRQVNVGISLVL